MAHPSTLRKQATVASLLTILKQYHLPSGDWGVVVGRREDGKKEKGRIVTQITIIYPLYLKALSTKHGNKMSLNLANPKKYLLLRYRGKSREQS